MYKKNVKGVVQVFLLSFWLPIANAGIDPIRTVEELCGGANIECIPYLVGDIVGQEASLVPADGRSNAPEFVARGFNLRIGDQGQLIAEHVFEVEHVSGDMVGNFHEFGGALFEGSNVELVTIVDIENARGDILFSQSTLFQNELTDSIMHFGVISQDLIVPGPHYYHELTGDNVRGEWFMNNLVVAVPSAIPIPAAVWLFSPVVLGFLGLTRRRARQRLT